MSDRLPKFRCLCLWLSERCQNVATAEDGLCNWCAVHGTRTQEQLRADPKAITLPDGEFMGIGGGGQTHDAPLADAHGFQPTACWYPDSGRTVLSLLQLREDGPDE